MTYFNPFSLLCREPSPDTSWSPNEPLLDDIITYEGRLIHIIIPEYPLARGSLTLKPSSDVAEFIQWTTGHHFEARQLISKVITCWKKHNINEYMLYGKVAAEPNGPFQWEIVPYHASETRLIVQIGIISNIAFHNSRLSKSERQLIAKEISDELNETSSPNAPIQESSSPLTYDPNIVIKQRVFEGTEIDILYNKAPITIGETKLHFIILPKQPRKALSNVTESEYLEAMNLTQKLIRHYQTKSDLTAYIFDKSGEIAGRTAPYWQNEIIFTAAKTEQIIGKFSVLKNLLTTPPTLSPIDLESQVQLLKTELINLN